MTTALKNEENSFSLLSHDTYYAFCKIKQADKALIFFSKA